MKIEGTKFRSIWNIQLAEKGFPSDFKIWNKIEPYPDNTNRESWIGEKFLPTRTWDVSCLFNFCSLFHFDNKLIGIVSLATVFIYETCCCQPKNRFQRRCTLGCRSKFFTSLQILHELPTKENSSDCKFLNSVSACRVNPRLITAT